MADNFRPQDPQEAQEPQHCSFCGRSRYQTGRMVTQLDVAICQDCLKIAGEMFARFQVVEGVSEELQDRLLTPREIKARLDDYVIGQEEAKTILSVAVHNHYKRIAYAAKHGGDDVEIEKSNILLVGPSGSGKTLLARTLARVLKVPFAIADATSLTEAGYVGEDVENILVLLLQNAGYDIESASRGIIYIDEIDKISRKGANASLTRDVSGEGVQQSLLKIIEGTVANVPPKGGRKHPQQEFLRLDTTNILFIVGGAFIGLDKVVESRMAGSAMGFGARVRTTKDQSLSALLENVQPQDLVQFGLIPEFVGRIPIVTHVDELDEDSLIRILTGPRNALVKQYQKLFELEDVKLEFTPEALRAIAAEAVKRKTGARGLRSVIERTMLDIMYRLPSMPEVTACIITDGVIERKERPTLLKGEEQVPWPEGAPVVAASPANGSEARQ